MPQTRKGTTSQAAKKVVHQKVLYQGASLLAPKPQQNHPGLQALRVARFDNRVFPQPLQSRGKCLKRDRARLHRLRKKLSIRKFCIRARVYSRRNRNKINVAFRPCGSLASTIEFFRSLFSPAANASNAKGRDFSRAETAQKTVGF
jgi:hypothetical protein